MDKLTVLSLEQALSLSYGTQRFVHLGWRVIRIEATPSGGRLPGDPNRYVGKEGERPDLHAYFIGPNMGKESIALNLKEKKGREVLKRLIKELPADVFACNTLPKRYKELGIDYETLSAVRPDLIWVGLSAMGPDYPDAPGYDPALQAVTGYMDLTGEPDGPPMLCGVPFVDLKAGDEVFANVCLALAEKAHSGKGTRIDVSMAQVAASWLVTSIPLLDLGYGPDEVRRSGNEHREFVPVNVYPTADGYVYLAIGNDVQWMRFVSIDAFAGLASPARQTNEGRRSERESIHAAVSAITRDFKTGELVDLCGAKGLVAAPIHTVPQVVEFPPIRDALLETETSSGQRVRLPPPGVEREHLASLGRRLPYAPAYGHDTKNVLAEAGFSDDEVASLSKDGIVA
ncbi:MAG: CaiB/BaiF CoA transferase family protein [Planctomycetota bacterium]|jgi:crotonobetainyl-CoA:carnitine CoA-transferase CaiB-like acyl-CoA transferase